MLPDRLSGDLCSLIDGADRPCIAVRMVLDADGHKRDHRFTRGLMRSVATLTYAQAQAAADGRPDATTAPLRRHRHPPALGRLARGAHRPASCASR